MKSASPAGVGRYFFFSSRRRHTRYIGDWSSDVCSSDLDFNVPAATDRRIRSGAALDPNNPQGSTVYFQCNDGYLYALDANTGAQRWRAHRSEERRVGKEGRGREGQ